MIIYLEKSVTIKGGPKNLLKGELTLSKGVGLYYFLFYFLLVLVGFSKFSLGPPLGPPLVTISHSKVSLKSLKIKVPFDNIMKKKNNNTQFG